ncbi:MAG: thiol reductant ABC exporter subunit CydD [Streptosporangiaceae bacterium]
MRPLDPRLLRYASAARGQLLLTIGLGLAGTGLILAQAGLLANGLASAASGTGLAALAGTLTALLAVLAARAAAAYGGEVAALRAAATVKSQLRQRLTAHALRLGPSWLGGQRAGEITTLATRGLDALDAYFARYLPQLVLACLVPLAVLVRVGLADWVSAVVIAVTLPLIPVFAILVGLDTKARTRRQWMLLGRLGGHFLDVVEGLPTLKLFGRASAQADVIAEVTDAHRRATMATLRVAFLSALVLELAATLATALVAVEVGLRLLAGQLSYQTALLVLLLTPEAYLPLRAVGAQFHASAEGAAAAEQAFGILDTPLPGDDALPGASARRPARPAPAADLRRDTITLHEVTLSYPGRDQPALDRVSLTVRPGDHIALTGPSGAGKTSLLALLLRFAGPSGGSIGVGDADLAAIPADGWLAQIAWVPQHPYLFTGSAAANIALGQPAAGREAIARAARLAGAADFIEALPDGYDTHLGERGLRLSAGQRQQIALARAFLRDAPLLLLDEPTAHLDPVSAGQVRRAVRTLMAGRTVIEVTHRGDLAAGAGRVVALDHGRLTRAPARVPAESLPAAPVPAAHAPADSIPADSVPADSVPAGSVPAALAVAP